MPSLAVLSLMLLSACETVSGYCPTVIRADNQTKEWFLEADTPDYVLDYLNRIGRQQESIDVNCP